MLETVDVLENTIRRHRNLLEVLLVDRTRTTNNKIHNILWATDSYAGHNPKDEIDIGDITGANTRLIQPRIAKSKEEQKSRTKDKAEVFTPKDIVYEMNQQVDWAGENWPANQKNWKNYVAENKLEITCGEAPFIVGRYNAVNGKKILALGERVGFLDRKLQTVTKYAESKAEWLEWAIRAFKASYGYEWQGDNLLLARGNLLYTFIDYWNDKFPNDKINLGRQVSSDKMEILLEVANIVSWNIFQMEVKRYRLTVMEKQFITLMIFGAGLNLRRGMYAKSGISMMILTDLRDRLLVKVRLCRGQFIMYNLIIQKMEEVLL